jgi:hypothetical protein
MVTIEELEKKVERLRMITEAKMSYLRDHTKLLDQAFNELKEVHEGELDLIYDKIKQLDKRMDLNGQKTIESVKEEHSQFIYKIVDKIESEQQLKPFMTF